MIGPLGPYLRVELPDLAGRKYEILDREQGEKAGDGHVTELGKESLHTSILYREEGTIPAILSSEVTVRDHRSERDWESTSRIDTTQLRLLTATSYFSLQK